MSDSEIIETFFQHEKRLTRMFHDNRLIPDHQFKPPVGFDFLLILGSLLIMKQQHIMYQEIRDRLTETAVAAITTNVNVNIQIKIVFGTFIEIIMIFFF